MTKFKIKNCVDCGEKYTPTGKCSKYCSVCQPGATKRVKDAAIRRWQYAHGVLNGTGSGSSTGIGSSNHMYTYGRSVFRRLARERKDSLSICENCEKDLKDATHYDWVGHHIDHNPLNNSIDNLKLLCKQCHQIEHQCWKSFEGVTTIPKGSSTDNSTKRLAPKG